MLLPQANTLLSNWIYVMVKREGHFVLPYTQARMQALQADASALPSHARLWLWQVLESLGDASRFAPGSYFPIGWWRSQKQSQPSQPPQTQADWGDFFQEEITIQAKGWFLGEKPVAKRIVHYFLQQLRVDAELGCYYIQQQLGGEEEARYVHHLLPPFQVIGFETQGSTELAVFNHGYQEPLILKQLYLGENEHLYLCFGGQHLPALLCEKARWQLLSQAEATHQGWRIQHAGQQVEICAGAPLPKGWLPLIGQ